MKWFRTKDEYESESEAENELLEHVIQEEQPKHKVGTDFITQLNEERDDLTSITSEESDLGESV